MARGRSGCGVDLTAFHVAAVSVIAILLSLTQVFAGEADVTDVLIHRSADGSWRFDVTVRHDDEGWDHYADRWEVIGPDGAVLNSRVLAHPHVNEQPFTRSLDGIRVPDGVNDVNVRAHDSIHGVGGREFAVDLEGSLKLRPESAP